MPPNAQDTHGTTNGVTVTQAGPAAAAAETKMDCFLTTACTPLNLQVGNPHDDGGGGGFC
jgi:hypothetical protein